jgi:hypothetical protein
VIDTRYERAEASNRIVRVAKLSFRPRHLTANRVRPCCPQLVERRAQPRPRFPGNIVVDLAFTSSMSRRFFLAFDIRRLVLTMLELSSCCCRAVMGDMGIARGGSNGLNDWR